MKRAETQSKTLTRSSGAIFEPVSDIDYVRLGAGRQILVCALDRPADDPRLASKWQDRAAAVFESQPGDDLGGLVRDLLANPQIRVLVLVGDGEGGQVMRRFWEQGSVIPGVEPHQLELVRTFVDLFEEDCALHSTLQPFWPERVRGGR